MKRSLLSVPTLLLLLLSVAADQPSVVPDGIRFNYDNPLATSVSLIGDFNGWSKSATPMQKSETGQWTTTLTLPPGTYQYAFLVDGNKTVVDPNNDLTFQDVEGSTMNSLLSLSEEGTIILEGYPVRRALNDDYPKKGGTVYLNLVFKHHLPMYYDPQKDCIVAPFIRMAATRDYFDMADAILRYPNVKASTTISPTLLWQIQEIYVNRLGQFVKKSKRNKPTAHDIDAAGYLARMKGKTDPWIDACLTPAERLTEEDKANLYLNEWNAFTMSPVRRQRFHELALLYDKWLDAKGNPQYTVEELRTLKFFAVFAHIDTEFMERNVPLVQTGTRVLLSVDLRDIIGYRSDGRYYLKRPITEDDCRRVVASAYHIMATVLPAFQKAKYNRQAKVGQLELVASSFSDAVLPLVINSDAARRANPNAQLPPTYAHPEDADAQLQMTIAAYRKYFGIDPIGYVPPFGAMSPEVVPLLAKNGFEWFTAGEQVLRASQPLALPSTQPYKVTVDGKSAYGIFSNTFMTDRVSYVYRNYYGENSAHDFMQHLLALAPEDPNKDALVTIVINADEHWMYYQRDIDGKGLITAIYRKLNKIFESSRSVVSVTMTEYIDGNRDRGISQHKPDAYSEITQLGTASAIEGNFNAWIGNPAANTAWEHIKKVREGLTGSVPDTNMAQLDALPTNAFTLFYGATTQDWLQRFSGTEVLRLNPKPFERYFINLLRQAATKAGGTPPAISAWLSSDAYTVEWARPKKTTRVTFICKLSDREAITSVYVVGNRKELANLEPNTVKMWDNGENGDEKFGDNYWTLIVDLEEGDLLYKYTNSGGQGSWEGSEAFQSQWRKIRIVGEKMTINDVFARFAP